MAGEGGGGHEQGALWRLEVGQQRVGDLEVKLGVDELVGPALERLQGLSRAHGILESAEGGGAHRHNALFVLDAAVDQTGALLVDDEFFAVHLVLAEVFHLHFAEGAKADVQGQERHVDALDFEALQQVLGEVQSSRGHGHRTLFRGVDGLEAVAVLRFRVAGHVAGERGLAQLVHRLHELFVRPVEQEAQGAAARRRVVDDFRHQLVVLAEVQLVADADFPRGVHEHVPQQALAVQLAKQEHLDDRAGLLLVAVHLGGKHLGVVGHEHIAFVEDVHDVLEHAVLEGARVPVNDHQAAVVAVVERVLGHQFFRHVVPELGELHALHCHGCGVVE